MFHVIIISLSYRNRESKEFVFVLSDIYISFKGMCIKIVRRIRQRNWALMK